VPTALRAGAAGARSSLGRAPAGPGLSHGVARASPRAPPREARVALECPRYWCEGDSGLAGDLDRRVRSSSGGGDDGGGDDRQVTRLPTSGTVRVGCLVAAMAAVAACGGRVDVDDAEEGGGTDGGSATSGGATSGGATSGGATSGGATGAGAAGEGSANEGVQIRVA